MERVLKITGLHCANCARELEEELSEQKGVLSARVDFVNLKVFLDCEDENAMKKAIAKINKFEQVRVVEDGEEEEESHKKEIISLVVSFLLFAAAVAISTLFSNTVSEILGYVLFAISYLCVGLPVLISTAKNIAKGNVFDENFLMTIASIGGILLGVFGGEGAQGMVEGVAVMLLYQLGELLQDIAVGSSRNSVSELMKLKSDGAVVIKDGAQVSIKAEEIEIGDILLVKAGEKIPVDGVLNAESALIDTKYMTGESEPRTFQKGAELLSGYVNVSDVFEMTATKKYENSAVQKVLDLVENSSAKKAAPEKFITKFAKIYTPVVCICALFVAFLFPVFSSIIRGRTYLSHFSRWALSALNFLVISCPCALVISVPLTYFSGIGSCAKRGILVKGATYLDVLSKVKTVAFDKTGTLTNGEFSVRKVYPEEGIDEENLLRLVSGAESYSSHPLSKAFAAYSGVEIQNVREIAGKGLVGERDGKVLLVGNESLLKAYAIEFEAKESVYTLLYIALDGRYMGAIEVGDSLRADTKSAIDSLCTEGIERFVMLTGDSKARAESVAREASIGIVEAELFPEDKLKKAEELKEYGALLYVGDGVNDAPVMAAADVAASMGKLGSAAAVEASDLVLVSDKLSSIAKGVKVAKKTRKIVMENIIFSIVAKVVFLTLGLFGSLPLWLAVFADVGVMLLAVLNSLRMKWIKG